MDCQRCNTPMRKKHAAPPRITTTMQLITNQWTGRQVEDNEGEWLKKKLLGLSVVCCLLVVHGVVRIHLFRSHWMIAWHEHETLAGCSMKGPFRGLGGETSR